MARGFPLESNEHKQRACHLFWDSCSVQILIGKETKPTLFDADLIVAGEPHTGIPSPTLIAFQEEQPSPSKLN